jgi:hypothetical protein
VEHGLDGPIFKKKFEKCNIKISKKELKFFIPLHITLILTRVNFQENNMIVCGLYENEKKCQKHYNNWISTVQRNINFHFVFFV